MKMNFVSTRNANDKHTLSEAIQTGLAEDGGLFIPEFFPDKRAELNDGESYASFAARLLLPFFSGDPLEGSIEIICREAFDFPVELMFFADPDATAFL